MKKFATFAAAAAVALTVAAPAVADEAKVNADPFVSSQGEFGIVGVGAAVAGAAVLVILIAAIDSGSDTTVAAAPPPPS